MNNIKLSVVRLDGCYTVDSLIPSGAEVWTISQHGFVFRLYFDRKRDKHILSSGLLFPTKELAEAASLSLSGGMALGDTVKNLLEEIIDLHGNPINADYQECDIPEQECMWCAQAKSILGDTDKGEG